MENNKEVKHNCFSCKHCLSCVIKEGKNVSIKYNCDKFKKQINCDSAICTGFEKPYGYGA